MKKIILSICLLGMISCSESTSNIAIKKSANKQDDINSTKNWFTPSRNLNKNLLQKNYYVVLDGSGSMDSTGCSGNKTKAVVAKESLIAFSNVIPKDDNLGLLVFDSSGISERVPLGINNRNEFIKKVNEAGADSGTPLKSAIELAVEHIKKQGGNQLGYGEYNLVVVTDGEANMGENPEEIIENIIQNTPIILHTIGFCIGEDHSLNQPGRTVYKAANNPEELTKGLQGVLAESEDFVVDNFGGN